MTTRMQKTVEESWQSLWMYCEQNLTLASRVLNFICQHDYGRVRIATEVAQVIRADQTLWESWDRTSKAVQFVAERLHVHGPSLKAFLDDRKFDARTTANPRFERRSEWIMTTWPNAPEDNKST